MILLLGFIVFAVIVVLWVVALFNRLVRLRNRYRNGYAQIDVQLRRRYDLIPNLVETAKGYLKHERGTLEAVVRARNDASAAAKTAAQSPGDPAAMAGLMGAESALGKMLVSVRALAEQYPDLKANQTMAQLMEELSSTENKISFARQAYNDAVMTYNTGRETFPSNLLAGSFGFGPAELFVVEEEAVKAPPKVDFTS